MNILNLLQEHQAVMSQLEQSIPLIEQAGEQIFQAIEQGGKVFFMGNGGSAADAQHLAAELVGRFYAERRALPGISLSTDTSVLTCLTNDYDYSIVFSRQLEALCRAGDVVVGLSTSGNSPNVLKGMAVAKQLGAYTIGMTGQSGGKLAEVVDLCFCVPSTNTPRIQEAHIFIGHTICELVEKKVVATTTEACTS
ncbi:MAG: D-sedoheptulose-7-phosphate isomerase [Gammaproteobacteria bacterium]